ncbi:MAG: PIN domain-containing protein [Parvibaculum sp.]|nr:PIN domain-containing protein [Parvibaculum sp.]
MAGNSPLYYWDTCLFLAWLKDESRNSGEMDGVREVIERHRKRDVRLMTSVLTSVEVLSGKIPAGMETLFDGLLKRLSRVSMDTKVAALAHDLRNHYAKEVGNKLKTPDAIHLATAILFRADEFHTFDETLLSLSGNVAGHGLIVCKPVAKHPEFDWQKRN